MKPAEGDEKKLVADIVRNQKTGKVSHATLRTDDRILARITDGIYRQPASAIRELITNAYDADAESVIIQTDVPRFKQITIRDDGHGMDIAALARLIHHIGGSAKRKDGGSEFGVTNPKDPSLSPAGRRLIGKIGIGLFSVSQLTRHFQVVTKVKGNSYRLVAEVILHTYTEDEIQKIKKDADVEKVTTGKVRIVSVPAEDKEVHGTEIILMDLRPQARDLLRTKELWDIVGVGKPDDQGILPQIRIPSYHVGWTDPSGDKILTKPKLPWSRDQNSEDKFKKLYQAILDEVGVTEQRPRLDLTLDNYLRMLWTLSLAAPINYIEEHPFDLKSDAELGLYALQPSVAGQARHLRLRGNTRLRDSLELKAPERGESKLPFRVFVDDIELFRPIRFHNLPQTSQAIKTPKLFVGKAKPDLSKISSEERGGDLEFEAYFLWAPKIVPKENNGLLIRISDASGTLFDESFAKYQVSELTRLSQITAEIFVIRGLDAALNIDRESFNTSHPHYQFIMRWVHRALRQLVNTLKQLAADVRSSALEAKQLESERTLEMLVEKEVVRITGDETSSPADVDLTSSDAKQIASERTKGKLALSAKKIFEVMPKPRRTGRRSASEGQLFRQQIKSVAQVLDAYGLLKGLTYQEQEELLSAIVAIFSVGVEK